MKLERNVGDKDKMIRIGAGAVFTLVGLFASKIFLVIGIVLLITGFLNFCGLYKLLGINTATPTEIATSSSDPLQRASTTFDQVKDQTEQGYDKARQTAQDTIDDIKSGEFTQNIKQGINDMDLDKLKDKATSAANSLKESADNLAGAVKDKTNELLADAKAGSAKAAEKTEDLAADASHKVEDAALTVKHKAEDVALDARQAAENAKLKLEQDTNTVQGKAAELAQDVKHGLEKAGSAVDQSAETVAQKANQTAADIERKV